MREINSLKIITLEIIYLRNLAIFITLILNTLNILICFENILNYLQLKLVDTKGINIKNSSLGYIYI